LNCVRIFYDSPSFACFLMAYCHTVMAHAVDVLPSYDDSGI
jgi:hypothetical protein